MGLKVMQEENEVRMQRAATGHPGDTGSELGSDTKDGYMLVEAEQVQHEC